MQASPVLRSILVVTLFVLTLSVRADDPRWALLGPSGGFIDRIVFDPGDSSIAYAASTSGLFRTTDDGAHWTVVAELAGLPVAGVAVAPSNPSKVYASSVWGFFGSDDRGMTWRKIHPFGSYGVAVSSTDPLVVYSLSSGGPMRSNDGGATFDSPGAGIPSVATMVVVDPQNHDVVYAALTDVVTSVYKSVNGGAQWTLASTGLNAPRYFSLLIDPANSSTLWAGGLGALFRTTNAGASWTTLPTGQANPYVYTLSTAGGTLIAATDRGVLKSIDGGSTWSSPKLTLARSAAIDPLNASNILANANGSVYRSTDGGTNYTSIGTGLSSHYIQTIAVDPHDDGTVWAGGPHGIFKSTDRGRTWTAPMSHAIYPTGPPTLALVVDPFESSVIYAISGGSLVRSGDGGATYVGFSQGLSGTAVILTPDTEAEGTLYAVANGSVYRKTSTTQWTSRSSGLPAGFFPRFLIIDPNTMETLYTGGATGIYKTVNSGGSWLPLNEGISGFAPNGLAVDPFDSDHLLTWSNDDTHESHNGGLSWSPYENLEAGSSFIFDPSARGRIYARSANFMRTTDGGATWIALDSDHRVDTTIVAIAPDGRSLYAGGSRSGVWAFQSGRRRAANH
jgi:photosystem II stability/assembly factor-like uncharacterized protein